MIGLMCLKELLLTKPMVWVRVLLLVVSWDKFWISAKCIQRLSWFNAKNYVAIVSVKWNYYIVQFWYMSKDEANNLLKNAGLN